MRHIKSKRIKASAVLAAAVGVVTGASNSARADTVNWTATTSGGDGLSWLSPLNWTDTTTSAHSVPTNPVTPATGLGDQAVFSNSGLGSNFALTVATPTALGGIVLGTSSSTLSDNLNISGSALTLYGCGGSPAIAVARDETTTGTQVIAAPITLNNTSATAAEEDFNISGPTGGLNITGLISQANTNVVNFVKNGDGVLTLSNTTNSFKNQVIINAGTLIANATNAIPTAGGNVEIGALSGSASSALLLNGATTLSNSIDVRSGSTGTVTLGELVGGNAPIFSGNINLYNNVSLVGASGGTTNPVTGAVTFSGLIQTGEPPNAVSSNVTIIGSGYTYLSTAKSTYVGTTTVSSGILQYGAITGANAALSTVGTTASGAMTVQVSNAANLSTGMQVAGPGVPLSTTAAGEDTITGIVGNMVTVTLPFASTLSAGTTLNFGAANPLGLSTSAIVLGDANTQANNSPAGLMAKSLFTFSRPITVSSFPTTGGYFVGTVASSASLPVSFTGPITLNQPLSILAETASPVGAQILTIAGGVVSGGGVQTVTFGSTNASAVSFGQFNAFAGNVVVSTNPIADGAGQIQVVVNAGSATLELPCTYTGSTTINTGGTIQMISPGSISNSSSINISGGLLQAAGSSVAVPYIFGSSQKVYGTGSIQGVTQVNGTLQVGPTNNIAVASPSTFNLSSGSTLNGTLQEDLIAANSSDKLTFTPGLIGTANLGGTLTITNPNNIAFAQGQSYQVLSFGANAVVGTFSTVNLPALPVAVPALGWNAAGLYSTGTITVGGAFSWNNTGAGAAGDGVTWDTSNLNWNNGGGPAAYSDGSVVTFNDTNNGHYAVAINSPVAPGQITVNTANTYTFSGGSGIAGAAGLTKTGTGSLILSNTGSNAFGTVVLSQGTITGATAGALNANLIIVNPLGTSGTSADAATLNSSGSIGTATVLTISSNSPTAIGTVNFKSTTETAGSLQGNGQVVLANAAGTTLTIGGANGSTGFSGAITDNSTGLGSLIKVGTGIQTLSGANTFGGGTSFNGGELSVGSTGAIGSAGTLSFGGGTLQYSAANTTDYSPRFSTAANQAFSIDTNSQNVTLASNLVSTGGSLTKSGLGTLTLLGNNTYDIGTNLKGGVLALGSAGAIGSTGTIFFGGGTLQFSTANTTDYSGRFSTSDNQSFSFDTNGQNVAFANSLTSSNGGSLAKVGTGTLTLNSALSLGSGTVNVSAGTLTNLVQGGYGSANIIINPTGTAGTSADAATLYSNSGVSGAVTVNTKSATAIGSWILLGTSENIGSLAGTGAGIVSLNNSAGTSLTVGNLNTNTSFAGNITAPTGAGGGLGSLTKGGSGNLTLSGTNAYGGGTNINSGILIVGPKAIPISNTAAGVVTFGGGILQFSAVPSVDYSSQFSTAANQPININTSNLAITFATALNSSGGSLSKFGTGSLTLTQAVNLSGGISIYGGTLNCAVAGGFGTGPFVATTNNNSFTIPNFTTNAVSPIVVNSTGAFTSSTNLAMDGSGTANTITVNLNGTTETIGSIAASTIGSGTAKLVLNNSSGTVLTYGNSTGGTVNMDGTITDNGGKGSVIYNGPGTVEIGNTNTFGGGFTQDSGIINSGVNRVGNFGSGPFTINPTGTTGTAADAATTNDLASPSSGPIGTFNSSNAVTVNTNSATAIGTLNITVASETMGSLAGTGNVILDNAGGTLLTTGGKNTSTGFSGNLSDPSALSHLTYVGTGTFTLSGSNTYGGGTNVSAGTLAFSGTASFPAVTNLNISAGAIAAVVAHNSSTAVTVLQVNALTDLGLVNLTNNAMSVHAGTFAAINGLVKQGYGAGTWLGSGGITSSSAASDATHLTAVGVIINDVGGNTLYGNGAPLGLFEGTAPALDDVLVKYTYYGDTNLDGKVDGSDYSRIDAGFLSQSGGSPLTGWYNGDLNYDGAINGSDYTLMDNAFNSQGAVIAASIADPQAIATDQIAGTSSVPEPATLGLIVFATAGLLGRRRRQS